MKSLAVAFLAFICLTSISAAGPKYDPYPIINDDNCIVVQFPQCSGGL